MEKKSPECEMSLKWYIKKKQNNNLGNQWTITKSEINRSVVLQYTSVLKYSAQFNQLCLITKDNKNPITIID